MRFLPLGLDLRDRPCTVVGGGAVGTRKALTLLEAGAHVTVVAPELSERLAAEVGTGRVRWVEAELEPRHLDGARLVVLATDDPATNQRGADAARERDILLCDATSSARSEVIFGALLENDGLTVATFTDGRDPGRARRARDGIAEWLATVDHDDTRAPRTDTLLVLVAHGSRDPAWGRPLEALARSIEERTGPGTVRLAYSQFATPTLPDVVGHAAAAGIRQIRVLPLFMTAGGHVDRDIRPVVDELRRAHDETIDVELLPPVGELPAFRILLAELAREVTR